jgi:hypothetical protein
MKFFANEIQPGWLVIDATGEELGTVISVDRESISIQRQGSVGGVSRAPRASVREVDTGRVELSVSKADLT